MPRSGVSDYINDQTNRVSTTGTYRTALVVASKKGNPNVPMLVTGQTNFLENFTPNETIELGSDLAMFEAYLYLNEQPNLYVVRAIHDDALIGGCKIRTFKSSLKNESLKEGFSNTDEADFDYEQDAVLIYGKDPGNYNNDISVAIITDPEEVRLDGCFIVRVYKNNVKVEDHICSLDPSFKDGFDVNCYVENVLKNSLYIRAMVNDDEDVITDTSYAVNVVGTVKFTNSTIAVKTTMLRDHAYTKGTITRVADLSDQTAFYECTKDGTTAHVTPSFTTEEAYKDVVEDGDATWTLKEIVKKYETEKEYKAGDIVTITNKTKVMNFRAKTAGTTSTVQPTWIVDDVPVETVQDGTVTWVNLDQTEEVSSIVAYTYKQGQADTKLDLSSYKVYSDYYLVQEANLPKTVEIEDPTLTVPATVTADVTYVATYNGTVSEEHYTLPKASDIEAGAYVPTKLAGGFDGSAVTDGDRIRALNTLRSTRDYTFQLIWDGGNTTPAYQREIDSLCEARNQSCHGILSVPFENATGRITGDAMQDTLDYRRNSLGSSMNLELYTTHQLVYDQFNDRQMYVSPGCFVAARIMDVAQTYGWHYATAGENRGVINSLDTAVTYEDGVLDSFCDYQINPIIKEPGVGQIIGDDYTLISKACALQDAHISRYVNIYLRPRLRDSLKSFLFEFNDDETRNLITKMLETFMSPEVSSRAIEDYRIVCDRTNNKDIDIQNSICNVWVYIRPTYIIRWLKLGLILTNSDVQAGGVEEVSGPGA